MFDPLYGHSMLVVSAFNFIVEFRGLNRALSRTQVPVICRGWNRTRFCHRTFGYHGINVTERSPPRACQILHFPTKPNSCF